MRTATTLRLPLLALGLWLSGCAVPDSRYDPNLYDASGNVLLPLTSAAPECHEATTDVTIEGKPAKAAGMVCRQPDGSWHFTP